MSNYTILRRGARGRFVSELQSLLNQEAGSSTIASDGDFGARTERAVFDYQRRNWLEEDGVVGKCTWNALRHEETFQVLNPVTLIAQPNPTTCWAASTAMLLNRAAPVAAPPALLASDGGLLNDSELQNPIHVQQYCTQYNLKMYYPQTYTPDGLYGILQRGPAMVNKLWDAAGYTSGRGSSGHMIIFAGIRGNGDMDGTTIRIYDPWPVGAGKIYSKNYATLLNETATTTYNLYQRN